MSYKISMKNGINCTEAQWIKNNNLVDTTIKLAGDEAKDRLYEPKHKKKLVRVLTVIAYVFFVSLAAIMLSLYYVFLWNGGQSNWPKKFRPQMDNMLNCGGDVSAEIQLQEETFPPTSTTEEVTTPYIEDSNNFAMSSTFIKKLMHSYYPYNKSDN